MSTASQWLLIALGSGLIIFLSLMIRRLWQAEQARKAELAAQEAELAAKAQERRDYIIESIQVISAAMEDNQCELTEGCIRLKGLLDNFRPGLLAQPELQVLEQVWQRTEHIPRKEKFRELKINQRHAFHKEIEQLEQELEAPIRAAVRYLRGINWAGH